MAQQGSQSFGDSFVHPLAKAMGYGPLNPREAQKELDALSPSDVAPMTSAEVDAAVENAVKLLVEQSSPRPNPPNRKLDE